PTANPSVPLPAATPVQSHDADTTPQRLCGHGFDFAAARRDPAADDSLVAANVTLTGTTWFKVISFSVLRSRPTFQIAKLRQVVLPVCAGSAATAGAAVTAGRRTAGTREECRGSDPARNM